MKTYEKTIMKDGRLFTKVVYKLPSCHGEIEVGAGDRVWLYSNNTTWCAAAAWQCTDIKNSIYFKCEEDLKAYIRDKKLTEIGINE